MLDDCDLSDNVFGIQSVYCGVWFNGAHFSYSGSRASVFIFFYLLCETLYRNFSCLEPPPWFPVSVPHFRNLIEWWHPYPNSAGSTSTWHPPIWNEHSLIIHPWCFFLSFLSLPKNLVPMLAPQRAISYVQPVPLASCITWCINALISCGGADYSFLKLSRFACK